MKRLEVTGGQDRVWVIAENDGEAREIRRLLEHAGERVLVSAQRWGARWEGLESAIQAQLRAFPGRIYGVELAGPNPYGAINIDHHYYAGDDRRMEESSLEQVADLLAIPLSRWQRLVALNDRGYIPLMARFGASPEEIRAVRQADRAAQGVTKEQEAAAARDVDGVVVRDGKLELWCPDGFCSAHSDLLQGRAPEILLMGPDQWCYYGERHQELVKRSWAEKNWSGGSAENGYFGIERPGSETAGMIREWFWEE